MNTVIEVSVYAEPELGESVAGGMLDRIGLPGEWGCAHVERDAGDGPLHWTMLSRDVELFRSFRATAVTETPLPAALEKALRPELFEWVVPGWPDEWSELWPGLEQLRVPVKIHLADDRLGQEWATDQSQETRP